MTWETLDLNRIIKTFDKQDIRRIEVWGDPECKEDFLVYKNP